MSVPLKKSKSGFQGAILVLVESPAKCAKIESYLGPGYKCIATFGHFRTLDGLASIDTKKDFGLRFTLMDEKTKQIQRIRAEIATCTGGVIIATDDDREGEAIGWHVCDTFKLPTDTTPRIVFHEITKPAIEKAIQNPGVLNMDLVQAQFARQALDLLVGYNISPMLWKHIASSVQNSLSAGRCQSPALRLVYDNQREIDASPGKMVYNIVGYFTKLNLQFTLTRQFDAKQVAEEFLEESANHDHLFNLLPPKKVSKTPPIPFSTSLLQQKASSEMHYSPSETMSICQKLYEGSYITYMRTDSKTYSAEFVDKMKKHIISTWDEKYVHPDINRLVIGAEASTPKVKVSKKATAATAASTATAPPVKAQEAHEAIRPTKIEVSAIPDSFTAREQKLYKLIWTNAVESCMSNATCSSLTATITAPTTETIKNEYRFTAELVEFPGWKIVEGYEKENPHYQYLQNIKKNSILQYNKIKATSTMIELKSHYTEAGLIKLLEECGIGRPSTFSSLIDKIQKRGYVMKEDVKGKKIKCVDFELLPDELQELQTEREFGGEKNKLVLQPLGKIVIDFLVTHFNSLFEYDFTKRMEDDLDKVARGELTYKDICTYCMNQVTDLTRELKDKNIQKDSVVIDDVHTYVITSRGPAIKCITQGENGKKVTSYKSVKKDIDIARLKRGEYTLEQIVNEKGTIETGGIHLGIYDGVDIVIKKGKYGLYFVWGEHKKSLSGVFPKSRNPETITYHEIVKIIEASLVSVDAGVDAGVDTNQDENTKSATKVKETIAPKGMVRLITKDLSIRNGRFGDYIFYKTSEMKNPSFLKIKGFKEDYKTCSLDILIEWIETTYSIKIL
jgi:DNA topoisomerase-1